MRDFESLVQIGERNDHGGNPDENRDALGHASLLAGHLLVLASGLGGTGGGRLEGNLAVSTVLTHFRTASSGTIPERLANSLVRANDILAARAAKDPSLRGSGAACGAILVEEGGVHAARAGDVRVVIIRNNTAIEILQNPTPSPANPTQLVDLGLAAREGSLGGGDSARVLVTREPVTLERGDTVVLVSPGLHQRVDLSEVVRLISQHDPQVAASRLVDAARQSGATGGISVQILRFGEERITPMVASAPEPTTPTESLPTAHDTRWDEEFPEEMEEPAVTTGEWGSQANQRHQESRTAGTVIQDRNVVIPKANRRRPMDASHPGVLASGILGATQTGRGWAAPLAAAAGVMGLLWLWSPFTTPSEPNSETTLPTAVNATGAEETAPGIAATTAQASERTQRVHPAAAVIEPIDDVAGLGDYPGQNTPNAPAMAPPRPATTGFWGEVNETLLAGTPEVANGVRTWLEKEGEAAGPIEDRARARLAELQRVETALVEILVADAGLTQSQTKQLDRIFRMPADAGANQLNQFIKARHDMRGDKVFKTLGAYIRTHRTPELTRVFMAMQNLRPRPGPLTREWLANEVPVLLAGP